MANPNIVGVTTINGNTTSVAGTVASRTLVNNKASSGKIMKVNTLLATNNAAGAVSVTVVLYPQDDLGGFPTFITRTVSVPQNSTLIVIDRNSSLYLMEDKTLAGNSSAVGITFTTSFDEISSS